MSDPRDLSIPDVHTGWLYAVPFGDDGVDGDTTWIPPGIDEALQVPVCACFAWVLEKWKAHATEQGDFVDGDDHDPTGFWLLTKEHLGIACVPMENDNWGSDTQWYALVRSAKMICQKMAQVTLVAPCQDDSHGTDDCSCDP